MLGAMNAYSKDLRLKVLDAVDRNVPRKEVVALFGVSASTLKRWLRRRERTGEAAPRPSPGRTPSICKKTAGERRALWEQLEEDHDASLERHCGLWEERRGVRVSISTMSRAVRKLGWTLKKVAGGLRARRARAGRLAGAAEGPRPRAVGVRGRVLDQRGHGAALRQGAQRREGARAEAPRNRGKNVALISSISPEGMGPSSSIEGPSDTESFGLYLREVLCPALRRGQQVVVMDNLSVHRSAWARELVESGGAGVLLLPPYSPDFDPIEEAFSKVKGLLRKARARALGALFEATHRALGAVTVEDARGFFGHCGYAKPQALSL
jgi:transposase